MEEVTENETDSAYKEIIQRVGRVPHVPHSWFMGATNPDSPAHWAHKQFIEKAEMSATNYVYYSLTEKNPFLPPTYVQKLLETLTEREADRMLRGIWIEIDSDRVYYNYDPKRNFLRQVVYKIKGHYPVDIMCDFNIGKDKPMSWALGQAIGSERHIFKEFHINSMKTWQMLDELAHYGVFELPVKFRVFGDAAGKHNDTRS